MAMPRNTRAHDSLQANLAEVNRLLEIHTKLTGTAKGYRHNVEVLNKSAVVLLVACWEAFVEDLAETAFGILLRRAKAHTEFSTKVLAQAGRPLRQAADEMEIWRLAGDGWRDVMRKHKEALFDRYIGKLNTPKPDQVDELFRSLLGVPRVSDSWRWSHMTSPRATAKLQELVVLRGSIAHRVKASESVLKDRVRASTDFVYRVAVTTSNALRAYILKQTGSEPWPELPLRH